MVTWSGELSLEHVTNITDRGQTQHVANQCAIGTIIIQTLQHLLGVNQCLSACPGCNGDDSLSQSQLISAYMRIFECGKFQVTLGTSWSW